MGRQRSKHFDLPPRMQRKGRSYYYVSAGKWQPLGPDLARAKRRWAELEGRGGESVAALVQRYIDREDRAPGTAKQYRSYLRTIEEAFPISAAALTSEHVALWRELQRHRKGYCNGVLAVLVAASRLGEELGVCRALHVRRWTVRGRDVIPEGDEARKVAGKGPAFLGVAVGVAECVGLRIGDILALRWEDVRDGLLYVRTAKTGERLAFRVSGELEQVLAEARSRRVLGLYIVADDAGRRVTYRRFNGAWVEARRAAGVRENLHFHDVRAGAATAADAAGQDAQKLLGHATPAMTRRYLRGKRVTVSDPVRRQK